VDRSSLRKSGAHQDNRYKTYIASQRGWIEIVRSQASLNLLFDFELCFFRIINVKEGRDTEYNHHQHYSANYPKLHIIHLYERIKSFIININYSDSEMCQEQFSPHQEFVKKKAGDRDSETKCDEAY
jgi:hypothetical protein